MFAKNLIHNNNYLIAIPGAAALILLRIYDKATIFSALLVIAGLTALIFCIRNANTKKEYSFLAIILAITFAVRFFGYTGSAVADILLGLLTGLIMFVLLSAECLAKKHKNRFYCTLIFPIAYTLFLYFTEVLKINMPFRLDIYLASIPVLCQITALFGIYSLDFLIAWTASTLVFLINQRRLKQSMIPAVSLLIVLCCCLSFGMLHMKCRNIYEAEKGDRVRIACATGPYYGTFTEAEDTNITFKETIASFKKVCNEAREKQVEILVFSEEAFDMKDTEEALFLKEAKKIAKKNDMHLLLAYEVQDTDNSEDGKSINKLCWISQEGECIYDYTKHCLVPVIETSQYVRGDKNITAFEIDVHGKTIEVATAICYDADFDLFMSHMEKKIDLLLLPTWDWENVAEDHFDVARLRAISAETTLVRSVYDGWNAVIDSAGNVLSKDNTNDTGYEKVLIYDVPIQ